MATIRIQDVPEDVIRTLSHEAAARGESLQSLLLQLVTREAGRASNRALLHRFDGRRDGAHLTSAELLAEIGRGRP